MPRDMNEICISKSFWGYLSANAERIAFWRLFFSDEIIGRGGGLGVLCEKFTLAWCKFGFNAAQSAHVLLVKCIWALWLYYLESSFLWYCPKLLWLWPIHCRLHDLFSSLCCERIAFGHSDLFNNRFKL
jgi:hypothetical protein